MNRIQHIGAFCAFLMTSIAIAQEPPRPIATFAGHTSPVAALAFSADGKRIVSVCASDLRTWDPATGKELSAVKGIGGALVAISPDAKKIAVAIRTGRGFWLDSFTLFDVESGKKLLTAESYSDWDRNTINRPNINGLAFSPDGQRLAVAGSMGSKFIPEGVVTNWDVKSGKSIHRFEKLATSACAVAFSPDGKSVASTTIGIGGELPRGGEALVWDLEKENLLHTLAPKKPDYGEFVSATDVAYSPDGKRLAVSVSGDSKGQPPGLIVPDGPVFIKIYELSSGKELATLTGHKNQIDRVTFSPNGKWLASSGKDRVVRLWKTATGKEVLSFPFEVARVDLLAFSPDGERLAAGGGDEKKPGEIRVWACPRE